MHIIEAGPARSDSSKHAVAAAAVGHPPFIAGGMDRERQTRGSTAVTNE